MTNERVIKGIYSPIITKKNNQNSDFEFEEYDCIVKKRIHGVKKIIEDKKVIYEIPDCYFIIEYIDNLKKIVRKAMLEEVLFDTYDFLYVEVYKTESYIHLSEIKKKCKSDNENIDKTKVDNKNFSFNKLNNSKIGTNAYEVF